MKLKLMLFACAMIIHLDFVMVAPKPQFPRDSRKGFIVRDKFKHRASQHI